MDVAALVKIRRNIISSWIADCSHIKHPYIEKYLQISVCSVWHFTEKKNRFIVPFTVILRDQLDNNIYTYIRSEYIYRIRQFWLA